MSSDPFSIGNIQRWKHKFSQAPDEGHLLALAREFIATLAESDRSVIQAPPGEVPFRSADDVLEYALHLTQLDISLDWNEAAAATRIRTVGSLFIEAGKRLTSLSEARVLRRFEEARSDGQARD